MLQEQCLLLLLYGWFKTRVTSHTVGQQWCTLYSHCARNFLCPEVPITKPRLLLFPTFSPALPHTCTLGMQPHHRGCSAPSPEVTGSSLSQRPGSSAQFAQKIGCTPGPFLDHAGFIVGDGMIWAIKGLSHVISVLYKPEFYILLWIWMRELNFVLFFFFQKYLKHHRFEK